ncbi:MAG: hypothetical protein KIT20_12365 [Alphaproteobacteria bacterium]|nr:hypothetical protein [Alphaproteobacteria bacterium]
MKSAPRYLAFAASLFLAAPAPLAALAADAPRPCRPPQAVTTCEHPWGAANGGCASAWVLPSGLETDLARIRDGGRVHFLEPERAGCPAAGEAACATKAYLLPGDSVIVTGTDVSHACAIFISDRGRATTGWLPLSAIERYDSRTGEGWPWAGHWTGPAGRLFIRPLPPPADLLDAELSGRAADGRPLDPLHASLDGWIAEFREPEEEICRIRSRLLDPYLVVEAEDSACGPPMVGIYRRARVVP